MGVSIKIKTDTIQTMNTVDNKKLWDEALIEIESNITKANFLTWFKNTAITDHKDGVIYVGVPNTFVREWLSSKYNKFITKALRNVHPTIRNVEYVICQTNNSIKVEQKSTIEIKQPIPHEDQLGFNEFYTDRNTNLNPKYTFDSFIVGSFNEVAYAAAQAVAQNPGTLYNPLFIYGGVGLGKTHLLQSIGNKVKENRPDAKIQYLTSEKFANEFIGSIQNKDTHTFKDKYRKYNVLIIDDIQFFSGKLKIQEEFFHVFNSLYETNSQIIFSADKPPKHIIGLEDRLRSRFEGGMMVDVSKPEYESRLAILKTKAEQKGFRPSEEVLEYIASVVEDSIREIEGALNSIVGQSKIKGKNLNLNEIKDLLKKNIKPVKTINMVHIIKAIVEFYNIEEKHLFEKTRRKEIVLPRQIAMYMLREDLNISYPSIGQKFGGKDHTTVIYAYEKISNAIKIDNKLCNEIDQIRQSLCVNSE